jgi:hypothetical protein
MLTAASCTPSLPTGKSPVAVRAAGDTWEVLYAGCQPASIVGITLIRFQDGWQVQESDPPVWRVTFPTASSATQFVIGETPAGATEELPLAGPLGPDQVYRAVLTLADGTTTYVAFRPKDMTDNKVTFRSRVMTPAEFEKARACPTS